jgi:hypothetical protein
VLENNYSHVPNRYYVTWDMTVVFQYKVRQRRLVPTAASEAFAQDTVSGADRSHVTALEDGIKVAQVDSPVHIAEMAALVPLETLVDSKVAVAGSRVAADPVR